MNKLRAYQERDLNDIINTFLIKHDCLYQLPTGGGKSVVMEHVVLHYKDEKILILAHKRELVFQMRSRLQERGLRVGVIIGSLEEDLEADIIVASIRTVTRDKRIQTILDKNFDTILVDEAHHIRTAGYEKVLDTYIAHNPKMKLLGVTATPYRKDKRPLNKYFSTLICSDTIEQLQEDGFLAKFKVFYTPAKGVEDVEKSGNDFQLTALSSFMREQQMLDFLVDSYEREGNNNQMIVFCVDKAHAKAVRAKYIERGYNSIEHIDSDTKLETRAWILSEYAKGNIQIITCIETLTEGVDLPETKCIQLARPTQSLVLFLQMVGRGLRLKADGSKCIVLDNAGCCLEHKLPNSPRHWSLNPDIDPSDPLKKVRIVGKRLNGTFTEDEEEMAFLELIEMSPEEYAKNIEGGIEKSKEHNDKIDFRCREMLLKLGKYILPKIKNNEYRVDESHIGTDYYRLDRLKFIKGGKCIILDYEPKKINKLKFNSETFFGSSQHLDVLIDVGRLSEELLKPKVHQYIIDEFNSIQSVYESKVDISALTKAAREFNDEQYKLKLSSYLIDNNILILNKPLKLHTYFASCWHRDVATRIQFGKNRLLGSNDLIFFDEENQTRVEKKALKVDKILDIIKGYWP